MTALLAPPEAARCTDCGTTGGRIQFGRKVPGRVFGRCLRCNKAHRRHQRALAHLDGPQPNAWAYARPADAVVAQQAARQARELADRLCPDRLAVLDAWVPLWRCLPAFRPAVGAWIAIGQYRAAQRSLRALREAAR